MKFACILITNLALASERRKNIELNDIQLVIFLEENKVGVKDRVTSILKMISIKDVEKSDTRQLLRQKIIEGIKSILPVDPEWSDSNPIRKVLFEEFQLE